MVGLLLHLLCHCATFIAIARLPLLCACHYIKFATIARFLSLDLRSFYFLCIILVMAYDTVIIGSGVAGLSAALYCVRAGLRTLVLGGSGAVTQIDSIENYPGLFPPISGEKFFEALKAQVLGAGEGIITFDEAQATSIDKKKTDEGFDFFVTTKTATYQSKSVIYAAGNRYKKLGVPGEEAFLGKGVSYCALCDGSYFRGRDIVAIGGGESALNEALYLSNIAKSVTVIHRRATFRAAKATVDKVKKAPNIRLLYNSTVTKINGKSFVESVDIVNTKDGSTSTLAVSGVFIFIGQAPNNFLIDFLPKDEAGFIITDEAMRTNIALLYCVGDVRSKAVRQLVTAASDGVIAATNLVECLHG